MHQHTKSVVHQPLPGDSGGVASLRRVALTLAQPVESLPAYGTPPDGARQLNLLVRAAYTLRTSAYTTKRCLLDA